jgi:hypothetical protein
MMEFPNTPFVKDEEENEEEEEENEKESDKIRKKILKDHLKSNFKFKNPKEISSLEYSGEITHIFSQFSFFSFN